MDKIKLLTFSVIALLVLNLGTLGYLFFSGTKGHRPPPGRGPEGRPQPKEIIIEKLHFDAQQQKEYEKLILSHRTTINELDDHIRDSKNNLYLQLIKTSIDVKTKDSLNAILATYQKQIEITHFNHFQDIKKICHPNQLDDFYDLTEELSRLFSKPRPRPGND